MKRVYLVLTVIGLILPTYFVIIESIETGNILLYTSPMKTLEGMFANRISTIFSLDLLIGVVVFFIWTYHESKKKNMKNIVWVWVCTMLFGFASGLPLFLYLREKQQER